MNRLLYGAACFGGLTPTQTRRGKGVCDLCGREWACGALRVERTTPRGTTLPKRRAEACEACAVAYRAGYPVGGGRVYLLGRYGLRRRWAYFPPTWEGGGWRCEAEYQGPGPVGPDGRDPAAFVVIGHGYTPAAAWRDVVWLRREGVGAQGHTLWHVR